MIPSTGGSCLKKVDLCFVLDSSDSIDDTSPNNWNKILKFVVSIVNYYVIGPDDTRVAVVTYADNGAIAFNFTSYTNKYDLISAILSLPFRNSYTNTADGLRKMRQVFDAKYGDRNGVPNLAIVVSAQGHASSTDDPIPVATRAQYEGITMLVVGTSRAIMDEVKGMSSPQKQEGYTYWMTNDFDALTSIVDGVRNKSCEKAESSCYAGEYKVLTFIIAGIRSKVILLEFSRLF